MANKVMAEVVSQDKGGPGQRCGLTLFLKTQSREDAMEFLRIIRHTSLNGAAVHRALVKRGYSGGMNRVQYHRSSPCRDCSAVFPVAK